jgi:hypothetical protein
MLFGAARRAVAGIEEFPWIRLGFDPVTRGASEALQTKIGRLGPFFAIQG